MEAAFFDQARAHNALFDDGVILERHRAKIPLDVKGTETGSDVDGNGERNVLKQFYLKNHFAKMQFARIAISSIKIGT